MAAAKSLLSGFAELGATMRETGRRAAHRDEVRAEYRRFAERVREEMTFHLADTVDDVFQHAF